MLLPNFVSVGHCDEILPFENRFTMLTKETKFKVSDGDVYGGHLTHE